MPSFTITISNPGKTGDSAGFVDYQTVQQYGDLAVTKEQARNKVKGLLRYQNIIGKIGQFTVFDELSKESVGGSATSEATEFVMDIWVKDASALKYGEYSGPDALRYMVAEALSDSRTALHDYYDPEKIAETLPFLIGSLGTLEECVALVAVS